jgi:hypothetical protein
VCVVAERVSPRVEYDLRILIYIHLFYFILFLWVVVQDVDGAALHASMGLPPSLQVTEARANRLELKVQQNY